MSRSSCSHRSDARTDVVPTIIITIMLIQHSSPQEVTSMARTGRFWVRHNQRMQDPESARRFAAELARIRAIDEAVNSLAEQIEALGLTKAEVARAIGAEPSTVRRLLSASTRNPTVGTVGEMAAALGMKMVFVPMSEDERRETTEPMLAGARAQREPAVA